MGRDEDVCDVSRCRQEVEVIYNGRQLCQRHYEEEINPMCKVCGCTNEKGCPGGCSWIKPGLCSSCVGGT